MIRREDDGFWNELSETIACHHEEVFGCLTTEGGLSRWFPLAAEVDLQVGGQLVLIWDAKKTKRTTVAILDFDPGGRVVWDWYAAHQDQHAPVYWTVEPSVERGSVVRFRQGPFADTTESLVAMAQEASSWCWSLCNLRSTLEAKHDMRKVRPL